ncbi:MAG: glycosyltransferase family 2 protein [Planctomycetota bacterium]
MSLITILIPIFNEVDSLEPLHQEICAVADREQLQLEIIFVDDGSDDGSWYVMNKIARDDHRVQCIKFRKNFGKAAAIQAGVDVATGDYVVTMDGDLQDDPAEIPNLVATLEAGFDIVSGWKKKRHDPVTKRWPSKVFNWLVSTLSGVKLHDHNCGLKIYRRELFEDFRLYGERHRFIPILAAAKGWKVTEMVVNHRARTRGVSKYNWKRLPKGFLDLITVTFITSFNERPQHFLGGVGLASFLIGAIGLSYLAMYWMLRVTYFESWTPVHQRPLLLYSVAGMLFGGQLLSIGILAELFLSNVRETSKTSAYSIADHVGQRGTTAPTVETESKSAKTDAN